MLPVSGAAQLSASGASCIERPVISGLGFEGYLAALDFLASLSE